MSKWYPHILPTYPISAHSTMHSEGLGDVEANKRWLGIDLAKYGRKKSDGDLIVPLSSKKDKKCRQAIAWACPCLGFLKAVYIIGSCASMNICYKLGRSLGGCGYYSALSMRLKIIAAFLSSILGKNSVELGKLPFRCFFSSIVISIMYVVIFAWDRRNSGVRVEDTVGVSQELLAWNLIGQLFMWSSFLLTYCTSPAAMPIACHQRYQHTLSQIVKHYSLSRWYGQQQSLRQIIGSGENVMCTDIYSSTHTSQQLPDHGIMSKVQVCHRCRLQIPLRAGHCKELDRCVLTYDHFCYFVWSCIHRGNYLFFTMYLIAMNIYIPLFLYTARSYVQQVHLESKWLGYFMLWCILQWIFVLTLIYYHLQSLALGMTTRERIKCPDYLWPTNPFARKNILSNIMHYLREMRDPLPVEIAFDRNDIFA